MMLHQWWGLAICASALMGCQATATPNQSTVPMASGAESVVSVEGQYMQWSGGCVGAPPVSRSDWMLIHADMGCVYVHGVAPMAKKGKMVRLQGVWKTTPEGRRYFERR